MKTTPLVDANVIAISLKNFPKPVRKIIQEKRENAETRFLDDLKQLFLRDQISQNDFKRIFEYHRGFVFLGSSSEEKEIRFKKDGTPDLRSLPASIRKFFKSVQEESALKKKSAMEELLSKETFTNEDLVRIHDIYRTDSYRDKFKVA